MILYVHMEQELQLSLAKKERCIKEMESNLNEQKEANNRQREEIKLLNERLNNEARRIKSLERESDRLRSEISLLESKVRSFKSLQICIIFCWLNSLLFQSKVSGDAKRYIGSQRICDLGNRHAICFLCLTYCCFLLCGFVCIRLVSIFLYRLHVHLNLMYLLQTMRDLCAEVAFA